MTDKKISLSSGEVVLQSWGDENNPVILCLHGWLDNLASFYPLAEQLSDQYYVLLIDLPGHGLSDSLPEGGHYYIWQNIETLYELSIKLKLQPFYLLGHSMGGVVASLFSGTFPDKVKQLILLDSLGPMVDTAENGPKQLAKAILDGQRTSSSLRVFPSIENALLARKVTSPGMTDSALKPIVERNLQPVENGFSWGTDGRLRLQSKVRMTEEQVKAFFEQISVPILAIIAEQGILPKAWIDKRLSYLSNVRLEKIQGHHHFHAEIDGAEQSAKLIKAFLN